MSIPVSPKRTALLAAARERILVLDGAMGTMIQGLEYDEAAFRGARYKDFHRDLRGNNDNPLYYGNARGTWQGDTLVVDSKAFNERFWFSNGGLPHTEQLHIVERFTRTDFNTLKYEVTIDDPGA